MVRICIALLAALTSAIGWGADYRSIVENGTVMYNAPSPKAKKVYLVTRDYPVEVLVNIDSWAKVRDPSGELLWVEKKFLSDRRTVMVTVPLAEVRQNSADRSPLVFRVRQGVTLELSAVGNDGWAKVRHRDGQSGFLRIKDVWGI